MTSDEAKALVLARWPFALAIHHVGRRSRIPFWRIEDWRKDMGTRIGPDSDSPNEAWLAAAKHITEAGHEG